MPSTLENAQHKVGTQIFDQLVLGAEIERQRTSPDFSLEEFLARVGRGWIQILEEVCVCAGFYRDQKLDLQEYFW